MQKRRGTETRRLLSLVESSGYLPGKREDRAPERGVRNYEATIRDVFPEVEANMVVRMFDHYRNQRIGQGHVETSIFRDIGTVLDYLLFMKEPRFKIAAPWEWEEERWSAWCEKIATEPIRTGKKKGLAKRSQRNCQTAVRLFFRCIAGCDGIAKDVAQQFGARLQEFVHRWNTIVHVTDDNGDTERLHFTKKELRHFFATLKEMLAEAEEFGLSREALHLARDLVCFRTAYWFGLRADELLGLNTTFFFENKDKKEFGEFGGVTVWGKGSQGSGKKERPILTVFKKFPPLMKWYLVKIRPRYLTEKNDGAVALFLSERGGRLGYDDLLKRFRAVLHRAMIQKKLSPHSMRHSYTTHLEEAGFHPRFVQKQLGHVYISTTEKYSHYGNRFIREMFLVAMAEQDSPRKGGRKTPSVPPAEQAWEDNEE
jgi:site-specific recombinase XerD